MWPKWSDIRFAAWRLGAGITGLLKIGAVRAVYLFNCSIAIVIASILAFNVATSSISPSMLS
jgi:hypothetical protein